MQANSFPPCQRLFVACCEAGGAEVVSSLLKNQSFYQDLLIYNTGPAESIFERKLGLKNNASLSDLDSFTSSDLVLTSRSLAPNHEREVIHYANKLSLNTYVYLDHWVNFESFHIPSGKSKNAIKESEYLPKKIVVGDQHAYDIATRYFCPEQVLYVENEYFIDIEADFRISATTEDPKAVLFVADPLSIDNLTLHNGEKYLGFDEYDVIEELIQPGQLTSQGFNRLVIRPHPNHDVSIMKRKVGELTNNAPCDVTVEVSSAVSLVTQLAQAGIVLGIESVALMISLIGGRPTYSYIPCKASGIKCHLPHPELKQISDLYTLRGNL